MGKVLLHLGKVFLWLVWTATGLWTVYHVWKLPLPWWGKYLGELLVLTLFFTLYDFYLWWAQRRGAASRGGSAA